MLVHFEFFYLIGYHWVEYLHHDCFEPFASSPSNPYS